MPDLHLLTGAYALDALDDVERAGYERHLRTCPTCSAEVIDFREAAAGLADRVSLAPPVQLRSRVLAEIARTRQVSPAGRAHFNRPSVRRILSAAAAAVLIAGAAGLGGITWQSHRAAHEAQISADRASDRAARLAEVMTDPGRVEVVGASSVGGTATVVAAGGTAVFATSKLPAPPSGKAYQVWLIDKAGVRSAGLLKLNNGSGQSLVSGVTLGASVAVSIEPAGGSRQPTTKPVLNLKVL
jgi:anti-sigma-K factor RskA